MIPAGGRTSGARGARGGRRSGGNSGPRTLTAPEAPPVAVNSAPSPPEARRTRPPRTRLFLPPLGVEQPGAEVVSKSSSPDALGRPRARAMGTCMSCVRSGEVQVRRPPPRPRRPPARALPPPRWAPAAPAAPPPWTRGGGGLDARPEVVAMLTTSRRRRRRIVRWTPLGNRRLQLQPCRGGALHRRVRPESAGRVSLRRRTRRRSTPMGGGMHRTARTGNLDPLHPS